MDMSAALKAGKKNSLTREQAAQLYTDLQRNISAIRAKKFADEKPTSRLNNQTTQARVPRSRAPERSEPQREHGGSAGHVIAMGLVLMFALAKVTFGVLEYSGVLSAEKAEASMTAQPRQNMNAALSRTPSGAEYSKEELSILTSLDQRRVELEERSKRLDERQSDLDKRDREYAARQTQLKELTDTLRGDREKNEKKRSTQLDQLANVYGSMDPKEAATLIEQLDVTIALALLERMPEKRIGQVLATMNPQRALTLTKMLSGRIE